MRLKISPLLLSIFIILSILLTFWILVFIKNSYFDEISAEFGKISARKERYIGDLKIVMKDYEYIKIFYKHRKIFSIEDWILDIKEEEIDIDNDKKPDILKISFDPCHFWVMCPAINIFIYKNQKKPKIFLLHGYLSDIIDNSFVRIYPNQCYGRLYIEESYISICDALEDNYVLFYKLNKNGIELEKDAIKDRILSNLDTWRKRRKRIYVFKNKSFINKIPEIKGIPIGFLAEDYLKEKDLKFLDLSADINNSKINTLMTLYEIATYIDKDLANRILNEFFVFENEEVRKEFLEKYDNPKPVVFEERKLKEIKY